MEKNLGKVAITPKGTWDASAAYEQLDMVSYDGGSWLAKKPSTNITPADGEYWMEVAEKGSDAAVTEENIVSALGFEPEKKRRFELIESITLTEDTTSILRTAGPDGTPYKFTDVYVVLVTEPTDTSVDSIQRVGFFSSDNVQLGAMYNSGFKSNKYCNLFLVSNYGRSYTMALKRSSEGAFNAFWSLSSPRTFGMDTFSKPVVKINIYVSTANISMKAGGTIAIYAIRA